MGFFFLILLLMNQISLILGGHIYSWNINLSYNSNGDVSQITMPFMLDSILNKNCYLHLKFPTSIGQEFLNTNPIATISQYGSPISNPTTLVNPIGTTEYYIQTQGLLSSNTWYILSLTITASVQAGTYFQPIMFWTRAQFQFGPQNQVPASVIVYDQNTVFGILNVQQKPLSSVFSASIALDTSQTIQQQNPNNFLATVYYVMTITSQQDLLKATSYQIQIFNSFSMTSISCTVNSNINSPQFNTSDWTCSVTNNNIMTITFSKALLNGQQILIKFAVTNPNFVSTSNVQIAGYYQDTNNQNNKVQGQIIGSQIIQNYLFTNKATLSASTVRINWNNVMNSQVPLGSVFVSQPGHLSYNTINVTFQVTTAPPKLQGSESFTIRVQMECSAIVDSSIIHNLPYASNQVFCKDVSNRETTGTKTYQIACSNVGDLVVGQKYFITARVLFLIGATDTISVMNDLNNFGSIEIDYVSFQKSTTVVLTNVFTPSVGIKIPETQFILNYNFIGTDQTSGFVNSFGDTQVISVDEKSTYLSTDDQAQYLWGQISNQKAYSIMNTTSKTKGFLFLLQAGLNQVCPSSLYNSTTSICSSSDNLKILRMNLYYNPNAIIPSSSIGLTFGSKNSAANIITYTPCDSNGQCLNQQNLITDTSLSNNVDLINGKYQFDCGLKTITGSTLTPSDFSTCVTFDGTTTKNNTFFAIRQAQLYNQFQTTLQVSQQNLIDFIVCFGYANFICTTSCSESSSLMEKCTLINAYVLTPLINGFSNLQISIVNNWQNNYGDRVPAFIRITGNIANENPTADYNVLILFFDNNLILESYKDIDTSAEGQPQAIRQRGSNAYPCNIQTNELNSDTCQVYRGSEVIQNLQSNWQFQNGIFITYATRTTISLMVPIKTNTNPGIFISIGFAQLQTSSPLLNFLKIYRARGLWNSTSTIGNIIPTLIIPLINDALGRNGHTLNGTNDFNYEIQSYLNNDMIQLTFGLAQNLPNVNYGSFNQNNGAGFTISCRGVDIFTNQYEMSQLCYSLKNIYYYNQLPIYQLFCPLTSNPALSDFTFSLQGLPYLPAVFNEQYVFAYSLSNSDGIGLAINQANNIPTTFNCQATLLNQVYKASYLRSQQIQIEISIGQPGFLVDLSLSKGSSQYLFLLTVNDRALQIMELCSILQQSSQNYICTLSQLDELNYNLKLTSISSNIGNLGTILTLNIWTQPNLNLLNGTQYQITTTIVVPQQVSILLFDSASNQLVSQNVYWLWSDQYGNSSPYTQACNLVTLTGNNQKINYGTLVTTGPFFESNYQGARSQFNFTFTPSFSQFSTINIGDVFSFDISWVSVVQSTSFSCIVRNLDDTIDYRFDRIQRQGFRLLNVFASQIINQGNYTWNLICGTGSRVPTQLGYLQNFLTIWWDPTLTYNYQNSTWAMTQTFQAQVTPNIILKSKLLNTPGAAAQYTFVATLPMIKQGYVTMWFEFDRRIPPKFNGQGLVTCILGGLQNINCQIVNSNRIKVEFSVNPSYEYTIQILDIQQPSLQTTSDFVIQVSAAQGGTPYTNANNWIEIQDIPPRYPIGTFDILQASSSLNQVRNGSNHSLQISLPQRSILVGHQLVIYFWYTNQPSDLTPTCILLRTGSQTNWASKCYFIGFRTLFIEIYQTDSTNLASQLTYNLTIINGPSVDMNLANSVTNTLTYQLYLIIYNNIAYFSRYTTATPIQIQSPAGSLLDVSINCNNIQTTPSGAKCQVYIGYFASTITFTPANSATGLFLQDFNITFEKSVFNYFSIVPQIIQVKQGTQSASIQIGAKYATSVGAYVIRTILSGSSTIYMQDFPFIIADVLNQPCSNIRITPSTVSIMIGQRSTPIRVDLSSCVPVEEISVFSILSNYYVVSQDVDSQTLRNDENGTAFGSPFVTFIYTINSNATVNQPLLAQFNINGQDGSFYNSTGLVIIMNIIEIQQMNISNASTPVVVYNGNIARIFFQCSQVGSIYYGFYLTRSPFTPSYQQIYQQTLGGRISQVPPNALDEYWQVYGYQTVQQNINTSIQIPNIRMNSSYNIDYYCVNQIGNVSVVATASYQQSPPNYSTVTKLILVFNTSLTELQKQQVACALTNLFVLVQNRVVMDDGTTCIDSSIITSRRLLQTKSSINVNQTIESPQINTYNVYILRDLTSVSDNVPNQVVGTSFQTIQSGLQGIQGVSLTQATSQKLTQSTLLPQLLISNFQYNGSEIVLLTAQITNMNGFVVLGLGSINSTVPTLYQLMNGVDGQGTSLLYQSSQLVNQNKRINYVFSNLVLGQEYFIYITALQEDPSPNSPYSGIIAKPILVSRIIFTYNSAMIVQIFTLVAIILLF